MRLRVLPLAMLLMTGMSLAAGDAAVVELTKQAREGSERALQSLQELAAKDDVLALHHLGMLHLSGTAVPQSDKRAAELSKTMTRRSRACDRAVPAGGRKRPCAFRSQPGGHPGARPGRAA